MVRTIQKDVFEDLTQWAGDLTTPSQNRTNRVERKHVQLFGKDMCFGSLAQFL